MDSIHLQSRNLPHSIPRRRHNIHSIKLHLQRVCCIASTLVDFTQNLVASVLAVVP